MQTRHFKEKLEKEKATLEQEMQKVGRKNPSVPGDFEPVGSEQGMEPDVVDQADTIQSFENNEGILRDLEARYDHVVGALERIEKGTYGVCEVGGEKIGEDRLEADPAATTCKKHLQSTA